MAENLIFRIKNIEIQNQWLQRSWTGRGAEGREVVKGQFQTCEPPIPHVRLEPAAFFQPLPPASRGRRRFLGDIIFKPRRGRNLTQPRPFEFRIQSANGPDSYPDSAKLRVTRKLIAARAAFHPLSVYVGRTRVRHTCSRGGVAVVPRRRFPRGRFFFSSRVHTSSEFTVIFWAV